ncbi:hypothetical protein ABTZ99_08485 [Actinosynnema sp. NPDC002837]
MDSLRDAFNNPARVPIVVVHVDLSDAAKLKTETGEVSWLPTFGWFFDQVHEAVSTNGGAIIKFLTSGVVATFPVEHAAQAINAAILVQEKLRGARQDNTYRCNCSIGISTGKVVPFHNQQQQDYIGTSVDRAERLARDAGAGAIFVDDSTVGAANMMDVFSTYGNATNREAADYLGRKEKLPSSDTAHTTTYQEVLWDAQSYGIKSSTLTEIVAQPASPPAVVPAAVPVRAQVSWRDGTVTRWDAVKGSGFATTTDGTSYYLHRDGLVVGAQDLYEGATVFFQATPSQSAGRAGRADLILPAGITMGVCLTKIKEKFGFADIRDGRGLHRDLFIDLGPDAHQRFIVEQDLTVRIARNLKGPVGQIVAAEGQVA